MALVTFYLGLFRLGLFCLVSWDYFSGTVLSGNILLFGTVLSGTVLSGTVLSGHGRNKILSVFFAFRSSSRCRVICFVEYQRLLLPEKTTLIVIVKT